MPANRGTYCLIISCREDTEALVGKLGTIRFVPGYYAYIGSALNNMDKRIKRHMGRKKKVFWHIDYLTSHKGFRPLEAYVIDDARRQECNKAVQVRGHLSAISGFGASDCSCGSHLFYAGRGTGSLSRLKKLLRQSGFGRYDTRRAQGKGYG